MVATESSSCDARLVSGFPGYKRHLSLMRAITLCRKASDIDLWIELSLRASSWPLISGILAACHHKSSKSTYVEGRAQALATRPLRPGRRQSQGANCLYDVSLSYMAAFNLSSEVGIRMSCGISRSQSHTCLELSQRVLSMIVPPLDMEVRLEAEEKSPGTGYCIHTSYNMTSGMLHVRLSIQLNASNHAVDLSRQGEAPIMQLHFSCQAPHKYTSEQATQSLALS